MRASPILLWCLLSSSVISEPAWPSAISEELIVRAGGRIRLEPSSPEIEVELALNGGPLRPGDEGLRAPASGQHLLAVLGRDPAGNISAVRWVRLRVDGAPPSVDLEVIPKPIESEEGLLWISASSRVEARTEDDLSAMAPTYLVLGEEEHQGDGRVDAEVTTGSSRVQARAWAIDGVGQRSATEELTLHVDATPPRATLRVEGAHAEVDGRLVMVPSATLEVEVADAESGLESWTPWLDGGEVDPRLLGGPWTEGSHRVAIKAVDLVGNAGTVASLELRVDATPPEIVWRVISPGAESGDGTVIYTAETEVEVSAEDPIAGLQTLEWSANGERWQTVTGPIRHRGDRLRLRAIDQVGNERSLEASWRVDAQAPTLRLASDGLAMAAGDLELALGSKISLSAEDLGMGLERASYTLNGGSSRPLPAHIEFRDPGRHTLELKAVDRAGHEASSRWQITVLSARKGR